MSDAPVTSEAFESIERDMSEGPCSYFGGDGYCHRCPKYTCGLYRGVSCRVAKLHDLSARIREAWASLGKESGK